MVIAETGTCEYTGQFTENLMKPGDYWVNAKDRNLGGRRRLVGPNPRIRFWGDKMIMVNDDEKVAHVRSAAVHIGDTILSVAQPDDTVFVTRTGCGSFGISLHRSGKFLLAIGAVTCIPLGKGVKVSRCGGDFRDPSVSTWLDCDIQGHQVTLEERCGVQVSDYWIYVERNWYVGIPGTDECVGIIRKSADRERLSVVRSVTMLGNGGTRIVDHNHEAIYC